MNMTVLTVDDSRTMREMLRLALTEAGYRVVQAEDGVHGLEVLSDEAPDVIVTDINMPRMDGFGFIEEVRGDPLSRPADPGPDDRERRRKEKPGPDGGRHRLDRQAVQSRKARGRHPAGGGLSHGSACRHQGHLLPGM
jgi:hypothetical protein